MIFSTTPNYPPPGDPALMSSSLPTTRAPSPFLSAEQPSMLPQPESPIATLQLPSYMGHRHNISTASAPPLINQPYDEDGRG
jgi:hypothetical protein